MSSHTPQNSPDNDEQSIKQLITSAVSDASLLVSDEIALVKAEVKSSASKLGAGIGLAVGAAFVALIAFIFLLITIAYVLVQLGLPLWASFGIVTLVLFIVVAILGLLAKSKLQKVRGPDKSIQELKTTKDELASVTKLPTSGSTDGTSHKAN